MDSRSRDLARHLVGDYRRMSFGAFLAELKTVARADLPTFISTFVDEVDHPERLLASKPFEPYMWLALGEIWIQNDVAAEAESARWVAISTLHPQFPGLSFSQATGLRNTANSIRDGRTRLRVLRLVADTLRDPPTYERWEVFGGLFYLLVNVAKEAFREREVTLAYAEATNAWALRDSLPQTSRSVQAFVAATSQICAAACYLPNTEFRDAHEVVDQALETAWGLVESLADAQLPATRTLDAIITLSLAHENLARMKVRQGVIGHLSGFELTIKIVRRAFMDLNVLIAFPELDQMLTKKTTLPFIERDSSKNGLRKLLVALGLSFLMCGDRAVAEAAYELASSIEPHAIARIEDDLDAALRSEQVSRKVQMAEGLLRNPGTLSEFSPHQRIRLAKRYADYLRDTAAALRAAKLFTSSAFWYYQAQVIESRYTSAFVVDPVGEGSIDASVSGADEWTPAPPSMLVRNRPARKRRRKRGATTTAPGSETDRASVRDAVADEQGLERAQRYLDDVRVAINRENPLALIVVLKSVVISTNPSDAEIRVVATLMEEVSRWHPRNRLSAVAVPDPWGTSDDIREFLLLSATELAESFKPGLVPELLRAASRLRDTPVARRLGYAQRSAQKAVQLERYNQEALALIDLILIGMQCSDSAIVEDGIARLNAFLRSWGEHQGVVDLLDVIDWSTKKVMELVPRLVEYGAVQSAVQLLEAASGRLTQLLELRPHLIEGYGLVESSLDDTGGDGAQAEFFATLTKMISEGPRSDSVPQATGEQPNPELGVHEAAVHLVKLRGRLGALGRRVEGDGLTTWFALELGCDYSRVASLAQRLWTELRPTRRTASAGALRVLDELVVAPLRSELTDVTRVTFSLHGDAALLPLHAAHGREGFLIEQMEVSYDIGVGRARPTAPDGHGALVIGWDRTIRADSEAQAVREALASAVDGPIGPAASERALHSVLTGERLEVVHVAGHGDAYRWPRSLHSFISLQPDSNISARTWLADARPANFVFLNVCRVGSSVPIAGDVNGFPLAVMVKGAQAVVSAAGFIDPIAAQAFANDFYLAFRSTNSLAAFRTAARASIARSDHPSHWAPFLHYGVPYSLAARTKASSLPG